jgi:hypothetical protein
LPERNECIAQVSHQIRKAIQEPNEVLQPKSSSRVERTVSTSEEKLGEVRCGFNLIRAQQAKKSGSVEAGQAFEDSLCWHTLPPLPVGHHDSTDSKNACNVVLGDVACFPSRG